MMDRNSLANYAYLPRIKRGRNFHLYGLDGKRYLDLCRADGASLLGYSVPGLANSVKAQVDLHGWSGLPDLEYERLIRDLKDCFPQHMAIPCSGFAQIDAVFELLGFAHCPLRSIDVAGVFKPLLVPRGKSGDKSSFQIYLPFLGLEADIALAVLPALGIIGPRVILVAEEGPLAMACQTLEREKTLQALGRVSPLQAKALRSTLALLRGLEAFPQHGNSLAYGGRMHPDIIGTWREKDWQKVQLGSRWERNGPWLLHSFDEADWSLVFRFALMQGIILNPSAKGFNVLPGILSQGERQKLEAVLSFLPEQIHGL